MGNFISAEEGPGETFSLPSTTATTGPSIDLASLERLAGALVGIGDTTVTITVQDSAGNMSTCISTVTVARFLLKDFVVFSKEFTWLRSNARIISGNIGANASLPDPNGPPDNKGEVEIGERAQMLEPGSSVVGDTLRLRSNSQVWNTFFNELFNHNGNILGGRFQPLPLPVLTMPALPAITPGTQDVEVQANQTRTLTPGSYRKITVKNRGTLILTGGIYQVSSIDIRQDARVLFKAPTEVRVKMGMDTDANIYLGPDASVPSLRASQIVFYLEGAKRDCLVREQHQGYGSFYWKASTHWRACGIEVERVLNPQCERLQGLPRIKRDTKGVHTRKPHETRPRISSVWLRVVS